jgi:hypothetical protein
MCFDPHGINISEGGNTFGIISITSISKQYVELHGMKAFKITIPSDITAVTLLDSMCN